MSVVKGQITLLLARLVLAAGAVVVAMVGAAQLAAPTFRQQLDHSTIVADDGFAFVVGDFPGTRSWLYRAHTDDGSDPRRSELRLYEDARSLGPSHTAHQEIRQLGRGRFSHWGGAIWFSSSDGSDPRSNGRVYRAEAPALVRASWSVAAVAGLMGMALAGLYLLHRSGKLTNLTARSNPRHLRQLLRIHPRTILAVASLCFVVAGALAVAEIIAPTYTFTLSQESIVPELGVAHLAQIPPLGSLYRVKSDGNANSVASTLQLFEDGKPLGPAHSIHGDIRQLGQGRFSHWGAALRFSASDNSNPAANGRRYTITARSTLRTSLALLGVVTFGTGTLLFTEWLRLARPDSWPRYRRRLFALHRVICEPLAIGSGTIGGLVLAGGALGVAGVVLGWFFGGGTQIGLELGRFFPLSDALAYQTCGTSLAAWGSMGAYTELCARRVLYIAMLASLFPFAGWSAHNVLIVQGLLSGVAALVLALQIARLMGTAAALVASATLMVFAWEFTLGVFMTEVAGFVLGTLGLALLLAFSASQRTLWLFAGMAFLSAGMIARIGAILVVPAALVWVVAMSWGDRRLRRRLALGLAGAAVGPMLQVLVVWLLGADPTNTGGNFSATLYGMSTGSRRWSEAYEHFQAVFATQSEADAYRVVYAAAIQNIVNRPAVFIQSLVAASSVYWQVFFGIGALEPWGRVLGGLFALGMLRGIVSFRTSLPMSLLVLMFLGEVATTPLVGDGGLRVFAASIAIRFAICAGGLHWLLQILSRAWGRREFAHGLAGSELVPRIALGVGVAIFVLMVLPGLPLARYMGLTSVPPSGRCAPGLLEVVSRIGNEAIAITISQEDESPSFTPTHFARQRFLDDSRYRAGWYAREIIDLRPPVTIMHALDRSTLRSSSLRLLAYEGILAETDEPSSLCIDPSRSVKMADGQYAVIRDVKPLP